MTTTNNGATSATHGDPRDPQRPATLDIAVLGANGDAGRAITSALDAAGHRVIAVSRRGDAGPTTPTRARLEAADLLDVDQTIAACATADVIVCAAQPGYAKWATQLERIADNALAAAKQHKARLVMMDNLYMYAPATTPINEASPQHATDTKGALRRSLGDKVLAAHRRGDVEAVIARQSDFYGPGARNSALWFGGIRNGLKGRTMRALFDADEPHTFAYLPDTANAITRLVEDPSGDGQAWILPSAPPITQRALLELVNQHLERPVAIGVLSRSMVRGAGLFSRQIRESLSVQCQFDRPWETDWSGYVAQYGPFDTTPHIDAIRTTMEFETAHLN